MARGLLSLAAMRSLVLVALVAGTAHAEPRSYVEAGPELGATYEGALWSGFAVGAGARLSDSWWLHAQAGGAVAPVQLMAWSVDTSHDSISDVRGGIELLPCWNRGRACWAVGTDLGYRRDIRTTDLRDDRSGPEAVFRTGFDGGGDQLRFRAMFEGISTHRGDTEAFLVGAAYRF